MHVLPLLQKTIPLAVEWGMDGWVLTVEAGRLALQYSRLEAMAACVWWVAMEMREVDRCRTFGLGDALDVRIGPYAQGHC